MRPATVRIKVEPGIRQIHHRYEAYVKHFGESKAKWFPPDTPLEVMREWRRTAFAIKRPLKMATIARHRNLGYTYIYFIRSVESGAIKIGHAVNPEERFSDLQTGSPVKLEYLGAVAGHKTLEDLIHERFAADRLHGEWFTVSADLLKFMKETIADKRNPLLFLWGRQPNGSRAPYGTARLPKEIS